MCGCVIFFLLGIETIQWIQASDMQVQILQKLSMNPQQAADHSWKPVGEWSRWFQGIPCTDQSLCSSGACGLCSYREDQDQHCAYKICSQEDSETVPKTFTFIALFLKSSIPVNSQDFTVSDFLKHFWNKFLLGWQLFTPQSPLLFWTHTNRGKCEMLPDVLEVFLLRAVLLV